jgi:hypothetical protein
MKICRYKGLDIVVMTRDEHCPPHVHVGTDKWRARFEFSSTDRHVHLLDVVPVKQLPAIKLLESLRLTLGQAANLRRARAVWWKSMQSTCLENQGWAAAGTLVYITESATFDAALNRTTLKLKWSSDLMEIYL